MALSTALQEALFLKQLLGDMLGFPPDNINSVIFVDNKGTIELSKNPIMHQRSKHIGRYPVSFY